MSSSVCNCSRTGPGNGVEDRSRPDSFVGRAGRGQGNPGQGTGEAVGNSADLHRRPAARQRGPGYAAGQSGQGDHGPRRTGSRFAGERDGGGPAAGAGHGQGLHSGRVSADAGAGRLAGWASGGPDRVRLPVVAVSIQVDYNQLLRRITGRRNCPVCQTIYNVYYESA